MSPAPRYSWYAGRLRAMERGELAARVRRAGEARVDDALWQAARPLWRRQWLPAASQLHIDRGSPEPRGFLSAERVAFAAAGAPDEAAAIVARAEAAREGRVRFFGYPEVAVGPNPDYDRDPFTGARWPATHGKRLDYRRATHGDPKWIWELNRCQELPLLCLAWRLTGDDRFAVSARDRQLGWIAKSTPGRGIAWSNGFEAALRGASFALTFDALRGSGLIGPRESEQTLVALWQHARWIIRDRSFGSSANNHLIGEAAGLLAVGLLAPELDESTRWSELGLRLLEAEAARQILPDGGGVEQAFAYHLFVCDLFLLAAALLEASGREPSPAIDAALARAGGALALQVRPGEPDPAYGDGDQGRAFIFDALDERDAEAVAASLASAAGEPAAAFLGRRPDFTSRLLFGERGVERFTHVRGSEPEASGVLADTGLIVLRRAGVRVTFDIGALGYLGIVAHGHADALAVTLTEGADELITDPGTGTYFGDAETRRRFRSTPAHATVSVDGLDQAVYGGPFLWLEHPTTRMRHLDVGAGVAVAEVDGWSRLADPVRHRRAIVALTDGALLVYDRLDARLPHRYAQCWPLHPALEPRERGPSVIEALADRRSRLLMAFAPAAVQVGVEPHGVNGGSWSRLLEQVEPSAVVRAVREDSGSAELAALLVPARGAELPDPALRLDGGVATFTLAGRRHAVRFALDGAEPVLVEEPAP